MTNDKHMSGLHVENLTKEFPTRGEPLCVLCDVTFQLHPGENLAILGPSGSGKSTLLHIVGALDGPSSGRVTFDDIDPHTLNDVELSDFRGRRIGFVFQEHYLLPQLTALENVLVPVLACGAADRTHTSRAQELLDRVGLANRIDHLPAELSGGERQRVAVARALIRDPELLLADEPTGNLDRVNALSVAETLLAIQRDESKMLIVVTHSVEVAELLDRRVELHDGSFVE